MSKPEVGNNKKNIPMSFPVEITILSPPGTRKLALVGYQAEEGFSSNSGKLVQSVTERTWDQHISCYLMDCTHAGKIVRLQGLPLV